MVLLLIVLWLKETSDTLIEHMEQLKEAQLKVGDWIFLTGRRQHSGSPLDMRSGLNAEFSASSLAISDKMIL